MCGPRPPFLSFLLPASGGVCIFSPQLLVKNEEHFGLINRHRTEPCSPHGQGVRPRAGLPFGIPLLSFTPQCPLEVRDYQGTLFSTHKIP